MRKMRFALQALLGDELPGVGAARILADMDAQWGYFRLGSARAYFEHDADAWAWLGRAGLVDPVERRLAGNDEAHLRSPDRGLACRLRVNRTARRSREPTPCPRSHSPLPRASPVRLQARTLARRARPRPRRAPNAGRDRRRVRRPSTPNSRVSRVDRRAMAVEHYINDAASCWPRRAPRNTCPAERLIEQAASKASRSPTRARDHAARWHVDARAGRSGHGGRNSPDAADMEGIRRRAIALPPGHHIRRVARLKTCCAPTATRPRSSDARQGWHTIRNRCARTTSASWNW